MNVLVACEYSGRVRNAFRVKGHCAFSCDLEPSEDESPYHIQCDVRDVLDRDWDLVIAHPPCTHLCSSGARWWADKAEQQAEGIAFFRLFTRLSCRWAIENPVGIMGTIYREPDQIIQPWQFGHGETKATCLWLKDLPPLRPTNIVEGREPVCHFMPPSEDRWKNRSRTYPGIAQAMAEQWGVPLPRQLTLADA